MSSKRFKIEMNKISLIFIKSIVAVILFDSLGSIASRELDFNYSYLGVASAAMYLAIAFFIAQYASKKQTILLLALLGLFDATIGWYLSVVFKANTGGLTIDYEPFVLTITIITVVIYSALLGLLGWWLSLKFGKRKLIEKPKISE